MRLDPRIFLRACISKLLPLGLLNFEKVWFLYVSSYHSLSIKKQARWGHEEGLIRGILGGGVLFDNYRAPKNVG